MTRTEALQSVLAGEHAAVYAYGVVGALLRGTPEEAAARGAYARHVGRRNTVAEEIRSGGGTPISSAAAYDLGGPIGTVESALTLASTVELGLCGPYAELVGASEPAERATAADWCTDAGRAAVVWGGSPTAFPGLAERA